MITGLRTYTPAGVLISDLTYPVCRVVGSFSTGTSSGSITVSLPSGTVFYTQSPVGGNGRLAKMAGVKYVGGGQFIWDFLYPSGVGNYSLASTIYYGVY